MLSLPSLDKEDIVKHSIKEGEILVTHFGVGAIVTESALGALFRGVKAGVVTT